jgi:hypothetical protein
MHRGSLQRPRRRTHARTYAVKTRTKPNVDNLCGPEGGRTNATACPLGACFSAATTSLLLNTAVPPMRKIYTDRHAAQILQAQARCQLDDAIHECCTVAQIG